MAASPVQAQLVGTYPYTFVPNTLASAAQVNANFNYIKSQVNSNAAGSGVNADITALTTLSISSTPALRWAADTGVFWNGTALGFAIAGTSQFIVTTTTINVASKRVINVSTPTSSTDAATKAYVDAGAVPTGAVMPFRLASCPSGWAPLNGSGGYPDYRGRFVRSLNTSGSGIDPSRTLGSFQDHQVQTHTHAITTPNGTVAASGATVNAGLAGGTSGANSGNSGTETRPTNVALLLCEKT
jgi:hypothetical protein